MSTLQARKAAARPYWLPRGATEHADVLAGLYFAGKRKRAALADQFAAAGWAYARASIGTLIDGTGTMVAAAADAPRIDCDPVALAPLGLLLEGARTNLAIRSSEFDQWTLLGTAVVANQIAAPDGTLTADKVNETAVTNDHQAYRSRTWPLSPHTMSAYLKAGENSWGALSNTANGGATTYRWFDLVNGVIGSSGFMSPDMQQGASSWWRCSVTRTPTSTAGGSYGVKTARGDNSGSYAGTAGQGMYAACYQLEIGAFPSSFIPTTTAAVTRAADSLTRVIAQPRRIAMLFQVRTPSGAENSQTIWSIGDATNGVRLYRSGSGHIRLTVTAGGVDIADLDAGGVGKRGVHKIAVFMDGTNAKVCLNGGAVISAAAAIPTLSTLVERIGSSAAGEEWFGHLQSYTVFGTLTEPEMAARTAPPLYINALIGIDSLSDPGSTGAGRHLRNIMWSRIGRASAGWIPLAYVSNDRVSGLNWTGGTEITRSTAFTGDDRTLDYQGRRWTAYSAGAQAFFTPSEPYDQMDVVWIAQPGDGTFAAQSVGNGAQTLDASAGSIITRSQRFECYAAPNGTVKVDTFSSTASIVGFNFSRAGAGGFTYNPFGNGGYTVRSLAQIDAVAMTTILAAIKPTHFLFNGGMNDRPWLNGSDAATFGGYVRAIFDRVRAAAPGCKLVMIQSMEPADAAASYFNDYIPVKQQLALDYGAQWLDERTINANTASYALASAAGYMQDGVHPTQAFNRDVIAPWLADAVRW